jgi:NAD(P)-dependent dehydrogenase (short-subunit alcohol dehydrogenase family)
MVLTLITGANRGIGKALLDEYRTKGTDAQGTARRPAGTDLLELDVTDPDSLADLATTLKGQPIDLLVCNAGIYRDKGQKLADGFAADLWADTFATNVTGVFQTIQTLLPNLRAGSGAKIAIISSQMGSDERASGGSYIYRASKAAALNLGRNLAVDLRGDGIVVGIYHPGWVRTDMGGSSAAIDPGEAAAGLIQRFARLSVATTGCFETWDGSAYPF